MRVNGDTAISLSLVTVICGVIWKASLTYSMADAAIKKTEALDTSFARRREIDDKFKETVLTDLAAIKASLNVRSK